MKLSMLVEIRHKFGVCILTVEFKKLQKTFENNKTCQFLKSIHVKCLEIDDTFMNFFFNATRVNVFIYA